jgi:hypothetical protein
LGEEEILRAVDQAVDVFFSGKDLLGFGQFRLAVVFLFTFILLYALLQELFKFLCDIRIIVPDD